MKVGGIFLGPIFDMLVDKLVSREVSNYARREGIDRELKKLEKMLPDIRSVLADAEEKQITDARVKLWMDDLTDLAYDLDDLLDDFATQTLRLELMMPESQASSSSISKVRKLIPTCLTCFTPPSHNMMSKVDEITARLQDIQARKNSLNLKENVGGIFLGPIFEVLLDKLVSREVSNYARREEIDRELKKLEKMLPNIRAVLADAEEKQTTDDGVKSWMEDLRDLAHVFDHLLDELALRLKPIPTCCTCFTPSSSHNMMSKVEEITTRLQDIEARKNSLDLKERVREKLETTSLVDKSHVYGRENDKQAILELLLRDEASVDKVPVIPIVGMGGIGKTTLAQLVYNDECLEGHFDLKAWVCVSDDFDVVRVTKMILEAVTSKPHHFQALNMLQVELKKSLSGKRFLLVLDDVWNENYKDWELLQRPFMVGAPGSKIILTTRHGTVASTMSMSSAYHLNELTKDECLSLFAHHAIGRRNFEAHLHLKAIGEKIVKKCKGLPLAAKTVGGLLHNESRQREWENILNSEIFDLPEQRSAILPTLILGYHHLPSHLKQCFAYCATFPKDYEFDKDELILLWMGVGLLQLPKGKKQMEDFGVECFDDLLSRSFFQQSSGSKSRFVMHGLLNDLAQYVARDICFCLDKVGDKQYEIPQRARHLSYIREKFELIQKFGPLCQVQHLRAFLPLSSWDGRGYLPNNVLLDLLPKLQCLRVLSLSGYAITELPDSIGDLKHLRYLNLSGTLISRLPESVSTLNNLQTLLLRSCQQLCMLPSNIGNLINLRHLDISGSAVLPKTYSGIGRLTNLQTLSKFVVGEHNRPGIKELRNLRLLRGSISIKELQNVMDVGDANEANLIAKQDLEELELAWSSEFNDFRKENLELDVLDKLQPHTNLNRLTIEFYGGTNFPSWIGDPSFSEMVYLTLEGCTNCRYLPPLGQLPKLKKLCIRGMHEVQKLGDEFFGDRFPFPRLEALIFENMPGWKEWSCSIGVEEGGRHFPCLRELTICGCPKLIRVSLWRLPRLQKLDLEECQEVVLKRIADLTSLTSLEFENIIGLSQLEEVLVQSLEKLESLVFRKCNQLVVLWENGKGVTQKKNLVRLRSLTIAACPQLVSFGQDQLDDDEGLPCINLQELNIYNCVNLKKLPNELNNLMFLTSLKIIWCPKLVVFPKIGVPPMLKYLSIVGCKALKSLPDGMCGLERLHIERCSSLRSWPSDMLSTVVLKDLGIYNCMNLEYFSKVWETTRMPSVESLSISNWPNVLGMLLLGVGYNFSSLRELKIYNCDVVESLSFPERGLPNLRKLEVYDCVNLRSLPMTNQILQSLEFLDINGCPCLESIPERGGLSQFHNLRSLVIRNCSNLMSLPFSDQILESLESLETIEIYDCPCLESFPEGNLPPNLIELHIGLWGKLLKPLSEWGMHTDTLTSLEKFDIRGGYPELVSFAHDDDEYSLLPATLTSLFIEHLPNLESISSKGLQNLTSLQHLYIRNCPRLQSLPEEGLPSTLLSLQIIKCPLFKQRCSKDGGDYWPNIVHIPYVAIEPDHFIYWPNPPSQFSDHSFSFREGPSKSNQVDGGQHY